MDIVLKICGTFICSSQTILTTNWPSQSDYTIHRLHICSDVRPSTMTNEFPVMTLNNLMVRLK